MLISLVVCSLKILLLGNMDGEKLESALVTGGDGFIGWHLVSRIRELEPDCKISVIDLPTSLPRFPNVKYYNVDLSSKNKGVEEIEQIRPRVIFHAACTYSLCLPASTHWNLNYIGTQNVLDGAHAAGTVKAFIYHSSTSIIEDGTSPLLNATEDLPVLFEPEQKYPYPISKAHAERAVLAANRRGGMLTASMRPASGFGEADFEKMEKLIDVAKAGRANMQIGDGKNVYDLVYVGNYVHAHFLAAKALLRDSKKFAEEKTINEDLRVDGEAFHVTNDEPWLFWDFSREVARQAGFPVRAEDVKIIPRWLAMLMAFVMEWWAWISILGSRQPALTRSGARYSCLDRRISCEKAKRVLGYRPIWGMREGIENSVEWFRENGFLEDGKRAEK